MANTNAIVLCDDQTDDITFSGPAWTSLLNNMQDPRLSKVARSSDATAANTKFFMAYPEPITVRDYVLIGTNITEDATWRLTAYNDAGFSELIYTSNMRDGWTSTRAISDPDGKGVPMIMDLGEDVTAAYWQVEIVDTANPNGYVQMAKSYMGPRMDITFNFAPGGSMSRDPKTNVITALAGTPYFSRHKSQRTWNLDYPDETYAVGWDSFDEVFERHGLDRMLFVIPFPDDDERKQRQSFLATFGKLSDLQMQKVNRASTGIQLIEYVG